MESLPANTAIVSAFMCWAAIAAFLSIVLGSSGRIEYLGSGYGLLITVTYALVVPLLLATYLHLLDILSRIVDGSQLADLSLVADDADRIRLDSKKRFVPFLVGHLFMVYCALLIQRSAIECEQSIPSPFSPWVEFVSNSTHQLSWQGSIYYAYRGLNAYLALGMFATLTTLFFLMCGRLSPSDPTKFFTGNLQAEVDPIGWTANRVD